MNVRAHKKTNDKVIDLSDCFLRGGIGRMAAPSPKGKSFDFRMSKKVAELTQVVHMLFTRNHEREVEIDALKEAYEYEIELVIKDAKSKISKLEERVKELERHKGNDSDKIKLSYEKQLKSKDDEWRMLVEQKERLLQEERKESQNLRDLLINAQKDVEKLRAGMSDEFQRKDDELRRKDGEIEKLRKNIMHLERKLKEGGSQSNDQIRELENKNEKINKELHHLKSLFEETYTIKEALQARNKQLEHEYKNLRKDLAKKIHDVVGQQAQPNTPPKATPREQTYLDYNDELERLRREVHRYRMELCNRESNFNRTFSDFNPVVVDSRAGRPGVQQTQILNHQPLLQATHSISQLGRFDKMSKEKTFSYATSHAFENENEQLINTNRASSAVSGRFPPMLGMDQRSRLHRLMKQPKLSMSKDISMSREMLSKN